MLGGIGTNLEGSEHWAAYALASFLYPNATREFATYEWLTACPARMVMFASGNADMISGFLFGRAISLNVVRNKEPAHLLSFEQWQSYTETEHYKWLTASLIEYSALLVAHKG